MEDRVQLHRGRLVAWLGLAVTAVAGALGATNLASGWVLVLWVAAAIFSTLAVGELLWWLAHRIKRFRSGRIKPAPPPTPPEFEPRDPSKNYDARPEIEVSGAWRYRFLRATLHDVGDGWDRRVECEITSPSGEPNRSSWGNLEIPDSRRRVADKGLAVRAEEAGMYVITWRSDPQPPYGPTVISSEENGA